MTDFSSITAVHVQFLSHSSRSDAHVSLNELYGDELEEIADLFLDATKTALAVDVVDTIKRRIVDTLIIPQATQTQDTTRIPSLILQAKFHVRTARNALTRLSKKSLATAMALAVAAGLPTVELYISTRHFTFHPTADITFLDWQYISDTPFDVPTAPPAPASDAILTPGAFVEAVKVAVTTAFARPPPSPPASAPATDLAKDTLKAAVGGVDVVLPAVCDSTSASVSDPPPALSITADDMEPAFADAFSVLPQPSPVDLAAAIAPALATIVLGHIDRLDCLTVAAGNLSVLQPAPRPNALLRAMVHCQDVTHCGIRICYPIVDPTAMPLGLYIDPIRCYPFDPGGGYVSCQTLQSKFAVAHFPLTAVTTPYLVCDSVHRFDSCTACHLGHWGNSSSITLLFDPDTAVDVNAADASRDFVAALLDSGSAYYFQTCDLNAVQFTHFIPAPSGGVASDAVVAVCDDAAPAVEDDGFSPGSSLNSVRRCPPPVAKPNACGTTFKEGPLVVSFSAEFPPCWNDSSPTNPLFDTAAAVDPIANADDSSSVFAAVFLDSGRAYSDPPCDLNAVQFTRIGDVDSADMAAVCEPAAPVVADALMVARAHIDTVAHASATGQLDLLHDYRAFAENFLEDSEFRSACERAAGFSVFKYQQSLYDSLREELRNLPVRYPTMPFHAHIPQYTPVASMTAALGGFDDGLPAACALTNASDSDPSPALSLTTDDMVPAFAAAFSASPPPSPVDIEATIAPVLVPPMAATTASFFALSPERFPPLLLACLLKFNGFPAAPHARFLCMPEHHAVLGPIDGPNCFLVADRRLCVSQPEPRQKDLLRDMVPCKKVTHYGLRTWSRRGGPTAMPFGIYIHPIGCYPFDPGGFDPGGISVDSQKLPSPSASALFTIPATTKAAVTIACIVCHGVHRFDSCTILINTAFLLAHYVGTWHDSSSITLLVDPDAAVYINASDDLSDCAAAFLDSGRAYSDPTCERNAVQFTPFIPTPSGGVNSDAVAAVCDDDAPVVAGDPLLARAPIAMGATGQLALLPDYWVFDETFSLSVGSPSSSGSFRYGTCWCCFSACHGSCASDTLAVQHHA